MSPPSPAPGMSYSQGKFKIEYHISLVLTKRIVLHLIRQQVIATLSELLQIIAVVLFTSKLLAATQHSSQRNFLLRQNATGHVAQLVEQRVA